MAQLHLAEAEPQPIDVTAKVRSQMRRRVFWSAYALDRTVGTIFDLPFSIPDYQITVKMYANIDESELDQKCFAAFPDDPQGQEVGGKVLIAQFTTYGADSVLYGTVSMQGKNADGSNWGVESHDYSFAKPAPGAIALLGLAGFAGRRRRRA